MTSPGRKRKCEEALDEDETPESVRLARIERGLCSTCEMQCFEVREGSQQLCPLTVPKMILRGRCLLCRPLPRKYAPEVERPEEENGMRSGIPDSVGLHRSPQEDAEESMEATTASAATDSAVLQPELQDAAPALVSQQEKGHPEPHDALQMVSQQTEGVATASETVVKPKVEGNGVKTENSEETPPEAEIEQSPLMHIRDSDGDLFTGRITEGNMAKGKGEFRHEHSDGEHQGKSDIYEGEITAGCFEGQGTFRLANGDVYVGQFVLGNYSGHGKQTSANGDVYEGQWEHDRFIQGTATCYYEDGGVYRGDWKGGVRHGKGKMTFPTKATYEGEWKNDDRHGSGKTIGSDRTYTGQYKDDIEEGEGKLVRKSGDIYEGEFRNGKENGEGIMTFKSGDVYTGRFKNGQCDGKGFMKYKNGATYDGFYKDGNREGTGIFKSSKFLYDGEWSNDLKNGKGTAVDKDEDEYTGEWKDDKKHGNGKLCYKKSGKVKVGQWKEDTFVKQPKVIDADASKA